MWWRPQRRARPGAWRSSSYGGDTRRRPCIWVSVPTLSLMASRQAQATFFRSFPARTWTHAKQRAIPSGAAVLAVTPLALVACDKGGGCLFFVLGFIMDLSILLFTARGARSKVWGTENHQHTSDGTRREGETRTPDTHTHKHTRSPPKDLPSTLTQQGVGP